MTEAIRVLTAEHADMIKLIGALEHQLAIFADGGSPDYDVIEGVIDYCLDYPDQCHHPKEDIVYTLLTTRNPEAARAVGDLEQQHVKLAAQTQELDDAIRSVRANDEIPRDRLMDLARKFIESYRSHMEMEQSIFFPAALSSFTDEDWSHVDAHIAKQDDPLFGTPVAERFAALRDAILRWEREVTET